MGVPDRRTALVLDRLVKCFGGQTVIDSVSLEIKPAEVVSLLGASGCGKTTTLRCIAGFYAPDEGRIEIGERVIAAPGIFVPPEERRLAMVFQNYVLWPHMRAFDNIAYGLRLRRLPRAEIDRRVREVMAMLGLAGLEDRFPHALSGGQQQRVSVARSLVVEPDVLLLDEPFSNLDAKLRVAMRQEMRGLLKRLGTTAIYVTHDQEEAMVLSDRIFLMDRGRIVQAGTPVELFERPSSESTARFFGIANILRARVEAPARLLVDGLPGLLRIDAVAAGHAVGTRVLVGLRDEHIEVSPGAPEPDSLPAMITGRTYLGGGVGLELLVGEVRLQARLPGSEALAWPEAVNLRIAPGQALVIVDEAGA